MNRLATYISLFAFCVLSTDVKAQTPGTVLKVTVGDAATGALLTNAQVLVRGTALGGRTDMLGEAWIPGVPEGVFFVEARLLGYSPLSAPAKFSGKDTLSVTLLLLKSQTLPTVTVRDSISRYLQEFENRRRRGNGHYITQAELKAAHGRSFADVLATKIPGVRINNVGGVYSTRGPNNLRGGLHCPVTVWYNGVRGALPVDFRSGGGVTDLVSTDLLGAVEYYSPAYVPVQYRDGAAACGVLLVWAGG